MNTVVKNLTIDADTPKEEYQRITEVTDWLEIKEGLTIYMPALMSARDIELYKNSTLNLPALMSARNISLYKNSTLNALALTSVGNISLFEDATLNAPNITHIDGEPIAAKEQQIENLKLIAKHILTYPETLDMYSWHSENCQTVHCMAGHAQTMILHKRDDYTASQDGIRLLGLEAASHFRDSNEKAIEFLKQYA